MRQHFTRLTLAFIIALGGCSTVTKSVCDEPCQKANHDRLEAAKLEQNKRMIDLLVKAAETGNPAIAKNAINLAANLWRRSTPENRIIVEEALGPMRGRVLKVAQEQNAEFYQELQTARSNYLRDLHQQAVEALQKDDMPLAETKFRKKMITELGSGNLVCQFPSKQNPANQNKPTHSNNLEISISHAAIQALFPKLPTPSLNWRAVCTEQFNAMNAKHPSFGQFYSNIPTAVIASNMIAQPLTAAPAAAAPAH